MLAIQARRQDVVKILLLEGAEVDVIDARGNTPLSMATEIGGDLSISLMSNILAAGASKNDGSLHNAARDMNLPAVEVLIEYGHDPDFPSHLHNGRSALAELCLHGTDVGDMTPAREKAMEKVMSCLIRNGSDLTIKSENKSILLLALHATDALTTTRILLKVGMWKLINTRFNQYSDGKFTYSPCMFVKRLMESSDVQDQLLALLRANRCNAIFYANSGPQPDDAVGLPEDLEAIERARRARLERIAAENEDQALSIVRNREMAAAQAQIWSAQSELEDSRRRRVQRDELAAVQERAHLEDSLFSAALARKRAERADEVAHQRSLTQAGVSRAKAIGEAEISVEGNKQKLLLDFESKLASEKVDNERALSAIRLSERESADRLDRAANDRFKSRIAEQRRLVDSQAGLANRLTQAGVSSQGRIGYITGPAE
jgi:hypothetical protein